MLRTILEVIILEFSLLKFRTDIPLGELKGARGVRCQEARRGSAGRRRCGSTSHPRVRDVMDTGPDGTRTVSPGYGLGVTPSDAVSR